LRVSEQFPGAIMAWSEFEARVIRDMAELFPDLAERLIAVLYRIVDLLRIVQDHVAHPGFQGSYSMKRVAPALRLTLPIAISILRMVATLQQRSTGSSRTLCSAL
jgi:predicted RecB family nuclease